MPCTPTRTTRPRCESSDWFRALASDRFASPSRHRARETDVLRAYKYRRCIIPASGFYEWTGEKGDRQPHLFTAADGSPILAFAGLWEHWLNPANFDEVISATIIVRGAGQWRETDHDRMPVMLDQKDFDGWLDCSLGLEALTSASAFASRKWPVSKRLNRTGAGDDDPTLVEPLTV